MYTTLLRIYCNHILQYTLFTNYNLLFVFTTYIYYRRCGGDALQHLPQQLGHEPDLAHSH